MRDIVDEYLATKPTPEAMLAKARDYAKAGDMAAAFLVFRRAAETGNPAAQLELATFYDPLTHAGARRLYARRRARRRLVRARRPGRQRPRRSASSACCWPRAAPASPPITAKAKTWLQQAAAQNDADAKKALDALPK